MRQMIRRRPGCFNSHLGGTGQGDSAYVLIGAQPGTNLGAPPGHNLDSPRRHACLAQKGSQLAQGQRIVRRRFYNGCVSCQKCRSYFLIKEITGEVEGDNTGNDANGLPLRNQHMLILSGFHSCRNGLTVQMLCFLRKRLKGDGNISNLCPCFRDRLSGLCRQSLRQILFVPLHQLKELVHNLCFGINRHLGPNLLCSQSLLHCQIHILFRSCGNRIYHCSGSRIDNLNNFAVGSVCCRSVNKHFHRISSPS